MTYLNNPTAGLVPYLDKLVMKDSPVTFDVEQNILVSTASLQVPSASVFVGEDVSLENNGGFITSKNQITFEKKLLIGRTYDTSGTENRISIIRLNAGEEAVFQPIVDESFSISGDEKIQFVFVQPFDSFVNSFVARGTKGVLSFDLSVAKDPNDDLTLTDQELLDLPPEDKIQLVNGLQDLERRSGTGNPDFFDFDDPNGVNGNIDNDQMFLKTDGNFNFGRKLIVEGFSPNGLETTLVGTTIDGFFRGYLEAGFQLRFNDFSQVESDSDALQTNNATFTEIYRITITDRTNIEYSVQAKQASGIGSFSARYAINVIDDSGASIIQGQDTIYLNKNANLRVRAIVSGADLIIEVRGIAAQTYDWKLQAERREY